MLICSGSLCALTNCRCSTASTLLSSSTTTLSRSVALTVPRTSLPWHISSARTPDAERNARTLLAPTQGPWTLLSG